MGQVQIGQASIDEHGAARDGSAGDQTGKETNVKPWYNRKKGYWDEVIRCKDTNVAKKAAQAAVKLIESNLVGYDQWQRNTLWLALEKNNWDLEKYIASGEKTETDCAAFVHAVYAFAYPPMRPYEARKHLTMNAEKQYCNSICCQNAWRDAFGRFPDTFERYTDTRITGSQDNLVVGDMPNEREHHITIVVSTDGSVVLADIPPATADDGSVYSYSGGGGGGADTRPIKYISEGKAGNKVFNLTSATKPRKRTNKMTATRGSDLDALKTKMVNAVPALDRNIIPLAKEDLVEVNYLKGDQTAKEKKED